MAHRDRQASPAELIAGAARLLSRLSRHLDSLQSGADGAVEDVAAVLRTAMCPGKGDKVIDRLCKQLHIPAPLVRVSGPARTDPPVIFAIGGMPLNDKPSAETGKPPGKLVSVETWLQQPALVVRGAAPRRESSWAQVITMYANTFGAHLSGTIPELTFASPNSTFGSKCLQEHLIYSAGLVGELALSKVLGEASGVAGSYAHRRPLSPVFAVSIQTDGRLPTFECGVTTGPESPGLVEELLKVHYDGHYFRAVQRCMPDSSYNMDLSVSHPPMPVPEWWTTD